MSYRPQVTIYTNTDKEKTNYRKLRTMLFEEGLTFSAWGNKQIEQYVNKKRKREGKTF